MRLEGDLKIGTNFLEDYSNTFLTHFYNKCYLIATNIAQITLNFKYIILIFICCKSSNFYSLKFSNTFASHSVLQNLI